MELKQVVIQILLPDIIQILQQPQSVRLVHILITYMVMLYSKEDTEKQYNNMYMITGEPDYQEKTINPF